MGRWVTSPAYRAVAAVLVTARKSAGLSQRQLAAKIGRPYTVIANIERHERQVDVVEFIAIARAVGTSGYELLARAEAEIGSQLDL